MELIEEIKGNLIYLNEYIRTSAALNHGTMLIIAEDIYCTIFNIIFKYNLINKNMLNGNSEAVDLIDEDKKVIIQITASYKREKVKNTLKKDKLFEYASEDYTLKFAFVGSQTMTGTFKNIENPSKIKFNPSRDIITTEVILRRIQGLKIYELEEISKIIKKEVNKNINHDERLEKLEDLKVIYSLMMENKEMFYLSGPMSNIAHKSPQNIAGISKWQTDKEKMIENNKKIKGLIDNNLSIFKEKEIELISKFNSHILCFEENNRERVESLLYVSFPNEITEMISNKMEELDE